MRVSVAQSELRRFLTLLSGCSTLRIENRGDFYLVTLDEAHAFALWRALRIVPCGGQMIDVRMHSEPIEAIPITEPRFRVLRGITPLKIEKTSHEAKKTEPLEPVVENVGGALQKSARKAGGRKQRRFRRKKADRVKGERGTSRNRSVNL
jgi:hypothetical protein